MAKEYHIVYGEQAKAVLEESGSVDFSKPNVELILLQDNFNEGKLFDLKTLKGIEERVKWFQDFYRQNDNYFFRETHSKEIMAKLSEITTLDTVRLWLGNDGKEYIWKAAILNFLDKANLSIYVIDWSDIVFYNVYNEVISLYSVNVSSLPNIKIASQNFRLLSNDEKNEFSDLWIKLLRNNAELRVLNTSNEIEEAEITYYDQVLMSNCKSDFQPSFKVIGLAFGDLYNGFNSCGIGDMFLIERLKQLCYAGKLKMRNQEHGPRNGNIFEVALNN